MICVTPPNFARAIRRASPADAPARTAVVLRTPPARGDQAPLPEPEERRVHRTFVELQRVVADLLDAAGYPVPVLRPHHGVRLEHHQVQGALEHIGPALSYGHRSVPYRVFAVEVPGVEPVSSSGFHSSTITDDSSSPPRTRTRSKVASARPTSSTRTTRGFGCGAHSTPAGGSSSSAHPTVACWRG